MFRSWSRSATARMAASPFAFYRGAAAVMAADLAVTPTSGLRVQLCGDAHLSNFGVFAAPDRRLVFDLNDFDETLPGPWEWDVKRLAASFEIAARENGFKRGERATGVLTAVARVPRGDAPASPRCATSTSGTRGSTWTRFSSSCATADARSSSSEREKGVAKARTKDSLRALGKLTERSTASCASSATRP